MADLDFHPSHLPRPLGRMARTARPLLRTMSRTILEHGLITEGDRIMVALSGGKDSYTLLDLLDLSRQRAPVPFELVVFHLDQGQPGYDNSAMIAWLEAFGVPFHIHREDTYSVVRDLIAETDKSACGPCSRFRRGILYTWAEKLDCNKIALGHHREDTLQTFLMNLFYGGRLQAMPSTFRTDCDRFDVIRPMIECEESKIVSHAEARQFPIIPCNLCGSQEGLRRARMEELLASLESEHGDVRHVMMKALKNVRPSHLLDTKLLSSALSGIQPES